MKVIETSIPGVFIIELKCFPDPRGFFMETFEVNRYAAAGITRPFVQDNLSHSTRGVLRGLHLQNPYPQGKLVNVLRGSILDAVVDVRLGSPTFGQHVLFELNEANRLQLWAPRGFAHGFLVSPKWPT
jgi:dTDP-4-dehydrorhamnose 3,5-epimerase